MKFIQDAFSVFQVQEEPQGTVPRPSHQLCEDHVLLHEGRDQVRKYQVPLPPPFPRALLRALVIVRFIFQLQIWEENDLRTVLGRAERILEYLSH